MSTDTEIKNFVINTLTKEQFDNIPVKDKTQLYMVKDQDTYATTNLTNITQIGKDVIRENSSGIAIGTIFFAPYNTFTPKGAVLADGAEYDSTQFPTLWTDFIQGGKVLSCTYAEFNADVAKSGGCAKFGVNGNKFKVPLIGNGTFIAGGNGESLSESLPNITAKHWEDNPNVGSYAIGKTEGAFYFDQSAGTIGSYAQKAGPTPVKLAFDASRVSQTYKNGAKVQPNNVRMKFYVQVANGAINQSMIDWSKYMQGLEGKANVSGNNIFTGPNTFTQNIDFTSLTRVFKGTSQTVNPTQTEGSLIGMNRSENYTANHDGYNTWIYSERFANGDRAISLNTRKIMSDNSVKYAAINLRQFNDGTGVVYIPSPHGSWTGNEVVTAGWTKEKSVDFNSLDYGRYIDLTGTLANVGNEWQVPFDGYFVIDANGTYAGYANGVVQILAPDKSWQITQIPFSNNSFTGGLLTYVKKGQWMKIGAKEQNIVIRRVGFWAKEGAK